MRLLIVLAVLLPQEEAKPNKNPVALMKTSHGDVQIELFSGEAPKTVKNFIELAEGKKEWTDPVSRKKVKRPLYDGLVFHRVIKNFMVQGGCPAGTGKSNPGFSFEDEINATSLGLHKEMVFDAKTQNTHPSLALRSQTDFQRFVMSPLLKKMKINSKEEFGKRLEEVDKRMRNLTLKECFENQGYKYDDKLKSRPPNKGVIAMANMGPNTNGSQFFINLVDTPWLTGKHTVFGKVIEGMDVVEKIGGVKVGPGSKPVEDVKIISIRLQKK